MFLRSQALDDPSSAFDLIRKELARLLSMIHVTTPKQSPEEGSAAPCFSGSCSCYRGIRRQTGFEKLLNQAEATGPHLLRAELSIIRHVEEGVRYFGHALGRQGGPAGLSETLEELLSLATRATETEHPNIIRELSQEPNSKAKK